MRDNESEMKVDMMLMETQMEHYKQQAHQMAAVVILLLGETEKEEMIISYEELEAAEVFDKTLEFVNDFENNQYIMRLRDPRDTDVNLLGE